mmetsp:Transcript_8683/g.18332  ORF Transcript_8683/g.18332 Transcript_8683/m.18332 type:complete len:231 (+) Transcript_8683:780-1472(+)
MDHDSSDPINPPTLNLRHQLMRNRLVLAPPRPHLNRHGTLQNPQHTLQTPPQLPLPQHQTRPGTLLTHQINRTSQIHIQKVDLHPLLLIGQYLRHPRVLIRVPGSDLHPEDVLHRVTFQEGPFGRFALQELIGQCHLAAGDVGREVFHDATEGEVADRGERSYVDLVAEVDEFALFWGEGGGSSGGWHDDGCGRRFVVGGMLAIVVPSFLIVWLGHFEVTLAYEWIFLLP